MRARNFESSFWYDLKPFGYFCVAGTAMRKADDMMMYYAASLLLVASLIIVYKRLQYRGYLP